MLFLSESDVKKALTMDDVIESVEGAYRDYSRKLIHVPSRVTLQVRDKDDAAIFLTANYHSMPFYGLKQASSFPSNVRKGKETVLADIHLYSADTGEALAVMSATYLTAMKTGAASAIATKFLAKEEACILAIIGTGAQASTQLDGIQRVRRLKEVRLFDLDLEKAEKFKRYIEEIKNWDYNTIITNSANECIESADIVTTVTTSPKPVFDGKYLGDGIHLNAVGSFTPNMQEIDTDTVMKAQKIVTDIQKETWAVAGDLLVPLKERKITQEKLYAELGDIVAGKIPGRESEKEVTIYESVGFAALDIAVAITAYRKSLTAGIGSIVEQ